MRSISPFDTALQQRFSMQLACLAALALVACNSDLVSLGGGDGVGQGSGACDRGVNGVVEGDVQVSAQDELDELAGCTEVTGSFRISAFRGLDLAPLAALRVVRGSLYITGDVSRPRLESLEGLEALERAGDLFLFALDIESLGPLHNLRQLRLDPLVDDVSVLASVNIDDCQRLVDLTGLENLSGWDQFSIYDAGALESLRGLVASRNDQSLEVVRAPNLRDVAIPRGASSWDSVRLIDTAVEGFVLERPLRFSRLELSDNRALVSLEGLRATESVEELIIHNNDSLEQLPELPYLDARLSLLSIRDNDALRAVPRWMDVDDGDFLPPEDASAPEAPEAFFPPEFSMAEIAGNPQLAELALPSSFRVGGRVRIYDNPSLTTVDLGWLGSADILSFVNNAALTQVNIPVLETVDTLHVIDNPSLRPAVFENVRTFSNEMAGNLEAAGP